MKICSKCKIEKTYDEFYKRKDNYDGHQGYCKQCATKKRKQHYIDNKEQYSKNCSRWSKNNKERIEKLYKQYINSKTLSYWIVYLLPDHNYVGITNNPTYRMANHKCHYKRNTDNWVELARFENRDDALSYETSLHLQGYEGANPNHLITK